MGEYGIGVGVGVGEMSLANVCNEMKSEKTSKLERIRITPILFYSVRNKIC